MSIWDHIKTLSNILVIGAINIDLIAQSINKIEKEDSNPAKITLALGGVGGNICTNLARLGCSPSMLTVLADDSFAEMIKVSYDVLGIPLTHSKISQFNRSSIYLGVLDESDLYVGLNDMEIIKELSPAFIEQNKDYINAFDYIVVDNNLSEEALKKIADILDDQILIVDAVSAAKAPKLLSILHRIDYLKVNHIEIEKLCFETDLIKQLDSIIKRGCKHVLLTNKEKDVHLYSHQTHITKQVLPCDNIISTSGAGDAFISGFIYGLINKKTLTNCLDDALNLANQTIQVNESTNEKVKLS